MVKAAQGKGGGAGKIRNEHAQEKIEGNEHIIYHIEKYNA